MFSMTLNFTEIAFNLNTSNILMEASAVDIDGVCKTPGSKYMKLEAFEDNVGKRAKDADLLFCAPLNGEMVGFPESKSGLSDLIDYKNKLMTMIGIDELEFIVNGKSYSTFSTWPKIEFSSRTIEIYEMDTEKLINADENAMKIISKLWNSYQSKSELCYIMTSKQSKDGRGSKIKFKTEICSRTGSWWTVCRFDKKIAVRLSGLCESSVVDNIFTLADPVKDTKDRYGTFIGMTNWKLEFDKEEKNWKIHHKAFPQNTLIMKDSSRRPFGKKLWSVGSYVCAQGETVSLQLQLSNCNSDQFTCYDGTCINLARRCDKVPDCRDGSDEKLCRIVALDEKRYIKDDPPPPITEGQKLEVLLSINIKNILDINEVNQALVLKFDLLQVWSDSRLEFYNLKTDIEMNTLIFEEKTKIWVPTIIFSNTRQDLTSMNDKKSFVKVNRNMMVNGTLISSEVNEDIQVYKGADNEIRSNRVYEVEFICNYDMRYYPFDIQVCSMDLVVDDNAAQFLTLKPGQIVFSGQETFSQYYVLSYQIQRHSIMGKEGVKVSLTLGRRLLGVVLTAYTPTVLLNVIGHNANYFKSFFFEAVVTVNLTAMLVLATMFISIAESLPKTAYLKMMDYWLVFNLILPFIEVLLHTYMEKLTEEDEVNLDIDPAKIKVKSVFSPCLDINTYFLG